LEEYAVAPLKNVAVLSFKDTDRGRVITVRVPLDDIEAIWEGLFDAK
jgi:hypothetical protein